jgi:hypothetical protein
MSSIPMKTNPSMKRPWKAASKAMEHAAALLHEHKWNVHIHFDELMAH